jgi:hypothetical protein
MLAEYATPSISDFASRLKCSSAAAEEDEEEFCAVDVTVSSSPLASVLILVLLRRLWPFITTWSVSIATLPSSDCEPARAVLYDPLLRVYLTAGGGARSASSLISSRTAWAIGSIMAAVAVLLIHMDRKAVVIMKPNSNLTGTEEKDCTQSISPQSERGVAYRILN